LNLHEITSYQEYYANPQIEASRRVTRVRSDAPQTPSVIGVWAGTSMFREFPKRRDDHKFKLAGRVHHRHRIEPFHRFQ
jgi:hypothetical protein